MSVKGWSPSGEVIKQRALKRPTTNGPQPPKISKGKQLKGELGYIQQSDWGEILSFITGDTWRTSGFAS